MSLGRMAGRIPTSRGTWSGITSTSIAFSADLGRQASPTITFSRPPDRLAHHRPPELRCARLTGHPEVPQSSGRT